MALSEPKAWSARWAKVWACALLIASASESDARGALRNRYSFGNGTGIAFDGSTIEDIVGDANGVVRGWNGVFTGSQLTIPGGAQTMGAAYVDLPNGLISSLSGDATFEAWFTVAAGTNWARVFDFGDSNGTFASRCPTAPCEITDPLPLPMPISADAGDTLFVSANRGSTTSTTQQRFSIENQRAQSIGPPGGCTVDCAGTTGTTILNTNLDYGAFGTESHVVLTVQADNDGGGPSTQARYTLYVNGQQAGSTLSNNQLRHLNDVNNWLGRANSIGDAHLNGSFNEFRIWDHALTATEVETNYALGTERMGDLLELDVDATGKVTIINRQDMPLPMDYYRLSSLSGRLDVSSWNSFDDQEGDDPLGVGWDEAGNVDASNIVEYALDPAGVLFPAKGRRSLGRVFLPPFADAEIDLVLEYGGPSGYFVTAPPVVYDPVIIEPLGDYNLDGVTNAADYVVYRNRKMGIGGTTLPPGTDPTSGPVTVDDYYLWKDLYGTVNRGSRAPTVVSQNLVHSP